MRSFLVTLFVTITCIVSVYSLQCMHCESPKGLNCTETLKDCSNSEDTCATSYYEEKKGKDTVASWVVKGCKNSKECISAPATFSNADVTVVFGVACCKNNSCSIPENMFPTSIPNNLTCTTCFSSSRVQCNSTKRMNCYGNENKCGRILIDSIGKVDEHWSMRGCATEEFCSHKLVTPDSFNVMLSEKECTDSSSTHKLGILIPTMAVFWRVLF